MALSQTYLERLRRRRAKGGEHPDTAKELGRQARATGHTGPLVLGPPRAGLKGSWRDDARSLAQDFPEEFGERKPAKKLEPSSVELSSEQESTTSAPTRDISLSSPSDGSAHTPDEGPSAPGSSQTAPEALPAPPPIQPLPSSFWQAVLFGNPDSLVPGADATRALHLVADKLGMPIEKSETIDTLRAGALRKLLRLRFGQLEAERAMNEAWRSAPREPDALVPNGEESHFYPGVLECPRSMPAWRRELNESGRPERDWQIENGCWAG